MLVVRYLGHGFFFPVYVAVIFISKSFSGGEIFSSKLEELLNLSGSSLS